MVLAVAVVVMAWVTAVVVWVAAVVVVAVVVWFLSVPVTGSVARRAVVTITSPRTSTVCDVVLLAPVLPWWLTLPSPRLWMEALLLLLRRPLAWVPTRWPARLPHLVPLRPLPVVPLEGLASSLAGQLNFPPATMVCHPVWVAAQEQHTLPWVIKWVTLATVLRLRLRLLQLQLVAPQPRTGPPRSRTLLLRLRSRVSTMAHLRVLLPTMEPFTERMVPMTHLLSSRLDWVV